MSLTLTILGCGSSGGVPRIANNWGQCDPNEPRNRRRRCSVLLERRAGDALTRVLVDTSPDIVAQLNEVGAGTLDGVWYTHEHADHTHGIDDLRQIAITMRRKVRIWADRATAEMLTTRFSYCFVTPSGSSYPPILDLHSIHAGQPVSTDGAAGDISALAFDVDHGDISALGFRIGAVAYTPDINGVPEPALRALSGLDVWIVDALRRTPHPSHFCLSETLEWIARIKPRRAIITNMHVDLDYATLRAELPDGVEPAYDGMTVTIEP